jgi:hypothetical protein
MKAKEFHTDQQFLTHCVKNFPVPPKVISLRSPYTQFQQAPFLQPSVALFPIRHALRDFFKSFIMRVLRIALNPHIISRTTGASFSLTID